LFVSELPSHGSKPYGLLHCTESMDNGLRKLFILNYM
jgi:hypothetical protein